MAWTAKSTNASSRLESCSDQAPLDDSTFDAPGAPAAPSTSTTVVPASSPSISGLTVPSSGSATTTPAMQAASSPISQAHAKRLRERGLNPVLCAQLGVHTVDSRTIGFHYLVDGKIHNTKQRRGKGNMPWSRSGVPLVLWNLDCLREAPAPDEEVIITEGEFDAIAFIQAGFTRVVSVPNGAQTGEQGFAYLHRGSELHPDIEKFGRFILATDGDRKGIECRDALADRLGDERCRSIGYGPTAKDANDVLKAGGEAAVRALVENARPMWTDEVARLDDIPDPVADEPLYRTTIKELDTHGLRITLPCFWPLIGPYGSGKSVLLRQLLCGLWQTHGWRCLLTAFEERIKPRYQRDLRRHFIARANLPDEPWTAEEMAAADEEIRNGFVFLQRAQGKRLTSQRVLDRIEYAVRVYGVKVVALDPINAMKLQPPPGQSKTDFLGDFMEDLKDLGEQYGLVIIPCAHTSKDSTEKKMRHGGMLTLNDGEDTRHWGGKADMGWVMWRNANGPSYLNVDKVKDHETMGRPTLCQLELDRARNRFSVGRMGYDIIGAKKE